MGYHINEMGVEDNNNRIFKHIIES